MKDKRIFFILWIIISAAIAILSVFFQKEALLAFMAPILSAEEISVALSEQIISIKLTALIFLSLALPAIIIQIFNKQEAYAAIKKFVFSCIGIIVFYAVLFVAFNVAPGISSALIALDGQLGNIYAICNFNFNTILALPLAALLFCLAILFTLNSAKPKSDFRPVQSKITFILLVTAIALGFHIPMFILVLIYLPVFGVFMLGYLIAMQIIAIKTKALEKKQNSEHKLVLHSARGKFIICGNGMESREVSIKANTTFAELFNADDYGNIKFAVIGGDCGIIIDKLRFSQQISSFQIAENIIKVYGNSVCPVRTVAELYTNLLRKHGEIGALRSICSTFNDISTGKCLMSFKELKEYLLQESRKADTQSRKAVLQPAESLMHTYADEVADHCDFCKCSVGLCFSFREGSDRINWNSILSMLRYGRAEEALCLGRNIEPLFLSIIHIEKDGEAAEAVRLLKKLNDPFVNTGYSHIFPKLRDNCKRVAVIGGGSAGITAAFNLRLSGYAVTVFEKSASLGGALRYYPETILPQKALASDIESFLNTDIEFKFNSELGKDFTIDVIKNEFAAILLAIGAEYQKTPSLKGYENAIFASDFLLNKEFEATKGKSVAIIGNNEKAMLSASVCNDFEAEKIYIFCNEETASAFDAMHSSAFEIISSNSVAAIENFDAGFKLLLQDGGTIACDLVIYSLNSYVDNQMLLQNGIAVGDITPKFDSLSYITEKSNVYVCGSCTSPQIKLKDSLNTAKAAAASIALQLKDE